jgi:hypothetical protein
MTPCDAVWDLLSLYADGEADTNERELVETHVACCETCALDLQFLRETATVLAKTPLVSPPPDLKQAILAATIYRPTWQERLRETLGGALSPAGLRFAGTAAATALVGFVLFQALQQPGPSPVSILPTPATTAQSHPPVHSGTSSLARTGSVRPAPALRNEERKALDKAAGDVERLVGAGPVDIPVAVKRSPAGGLAPKMTPAVYTRITPRRQNFHGPDEKQRSETAAVTPKAEEQPTLSEPEGMWPAAGSDSANKGGVVKNDNAPEKRDSTSTEPGTPAPAPRRYTLTASAPSGGADTLVTFADLRSALRKRNESARTVALDLGMNDRHALWDVYKSRF